MLAPEVALRGQLAYAPINRWRGTLSGRPMEGHTSMTTDTHLGDIVEYTTATGNKCTAQIVGTENTVTAGRWEHVITREERIERLAGDDYHREGRRHDGTAPTTLDADGDYWVASPVPPVKPGRFHLKVTAPTGGTYVEFNVPPFDGVTGPDEHVDYDADRRCTFEWKS